jgi:hypothetical protein
LTSVDVYRPYLKSIAAETNTESKKATQTNPEKAEKSLRVEVAIGGKQAH